MSHTFIETFYLKGLVIVQSFANSRITLRTMQCLNKFKSNQRRSLLFPTQTRITLRRVVPVALGNVRMSPVVVFMGHPPARSIQVLLKNVMENVHIWALL